MFVKYDICFVDGSYGVKNEDNYDKIVEFHRKHIDYYLNFMYLTILKTLNRSVELV